MQQQLIDGVLVSYTESGFDEFAREALSILRTEDMGHYRIVKQWLNGIVQLGSDHTWNKGGSVGSWAPLSRVYFDEFTSAQRSEVGTRRYAAVLVRLAVTIRIIESFRIYGAWKIRWRYFPKATRIALKEELNCCERLNCDTKWIYMLQRLIRGLTHGA
jgi:hypothetical protein